MRRVLLTASESPGLLDLAVAARAELARAGVDLRVWAIGAGAEASLAGRGVPSLFPATLYRVPASARAVVRAWCRRHRTAIRAGMPLAHRGIALAAANAYEARIRRAERSLATRRDLARTGAAYVELFEDHLDRFRPELLILWWGEWAWSRVGAAVAARRGIPTLFFERGPFPGSAQLDPAGANGGATLADPAGWRAVRPASLSADAQHEVDRFRETFIATGASARPQPSRRTRAELVAAHGLPGARRWLFLPAQETTDAVHAIVALVPALRARPDLALIVKPHPAEGLRVPRLARALGPLGAQGGLVRQAHVHDLIQASDWVVTVSSSAGLEAALFDKPTLVMGRALYGGKGFTWDAEAYGSVDAAVGAVTAARTLSPAQCRERDLFCHHLITRFLLWTGPERLAGSARDMAERIRTHLPPPDPSGPRGPAVPLGGWRGEPTVWLSARDAYRDLRDRLRLRLGRWRQPESPGDGP